jgi:hypothetical protein
LATSSASLASDFSPRYPAPPRVHWLVLFLGFALIRFAAMFFLPKTWGAFVPILVIQTWGICFCLWIRRLNSKSTSIYWTAGSFLSYVLVMLLSLVHEPTPLIALGILVYVLIALAALIVGLYVIRAELLKHYTQVEPVGLSLGPVLTFFFSYVYFQYQLYDIAESKRSEAETIRA